MASDHVVWDDVVAQPDIINKCITCPIASHKMATRSKQSVTPPDKPLHTLYLDTVPNPRPKGITPPSRCKNFLFIVDHHSRFITMYGMPGKTSSDVITSLTHFIADYGAQLKPNTITRLHADAGTEFKSATFKNWAAKQRIRTTYAAPEHQHQNGIC